MTMQLLNKENTIKLVDKNNDIDYFKYNSKTKSVDFYEKNIKNKERER